MTSCSGRGKKAIEKKHGSAQVGKPGSVTQPPQVSPTSQQPNMAAMAAALLGLDPKSKEAAMLLMKGTLGTKPEDGK